MIEITKLDTIDFEALVEEGRGLIPRYAPDWTDHNLHDPGMTLLDLLAWFVDQQVYRIGFVGDAHFAAFAALLGIAPQGATPARGLIWPRLDAISHDRKLAEGARVHPREQPDLAFAVSREVGLRAARILRVEAHRGSAVRKLKPDETGAILLDEGTETIELVFDPPIAGGGEPVALGLAYAEPLPDLGGRPPLSLDYQDAGGRWQRAQPAWQAPAGESAGALLFDLAGADPVARLRLDPASGLPRRLLPVRVALNVVPTVQLETMPALKIGEGQGWPDFELRLGLDDQVVPGSEQLAIESVRGPETIAWTEVADFSNSAPASAHFVFDRERGVIRFGNGVNGRALPAGHQVSRGALKVTSGALGNLAAGAAWTVAGEGGFGINPEPVAGGADAWSSEELLTALRRRARKRAAMLTDADMIEAVSAIEGLGIERAEVLPRFLPALPRHRVPGARTLLLRAAKGVDSSDGWLDAIERSLAPRRVLGERLAIAAVEPVAIAVEALLLIAAGSDWEGIRGEAERRLGERLSVARRRPDQEIEPWPSGRPVTIAELETLLAAVEGVIAVADLRLARAGDTPARVSLPLERLEVAVADTLLVRPKVES